MGTGKRYSVSQGRSRPHPRKVVMVTNHGCMRVHKTAIILINAGYECHLITGKLAQFSEVYSSILSYETANQLKDAIRLHQDAWLFHVHNEPSWFVTAVKETLPHAKVVLDVHDSMLLRRTEREVQKAKDPAIFRHTADERNNLQLADGLVYPCEPMRRLVSEEYALSQPQCVVPSALPSSMHRIDFGKYLPGLCYEGRVDLASQLSKQWNFFTYCNYLPMAEACQAEGIPFFIYSTRKNDEVRKAYAPKCFLSPPLGYEQMLKTIGGHDWGLVGNLHPTTEWKYALPNKLFEYLGASMPIVCLNADESWRVLKDTGMAIRVESLKELKARWGEQRKCREQVVKRRQAFALERWLPALEEVYERVVEGEREPLHLRVLTPMLTNGHA